MGLREEFERCWPWLAAALKRAGDTHTKEDLWAAIDGGGARLWTGRVSACVTEFYTTPRRKVLNFWLVGGSPPGAALAEFLAAMPGIEEWGRAQGCTKSTGTGRPGWGRTIAHLGYRPAYVTFEKDL